MQVTSQDTDHSLYNAEIKNQKNIPEESLNLSFQF